MSLHLRHAAPHDKVADEDLHGFAVLVQCRRPHLKQPVVRTRLRCSHLQHFAFDAQLIPRTHGSWPAAFVKASADEAASGREIALDQESHGDRGGVPTAGCQSVEERVTRGLFVKMEGLRIEGSSEGLDLLRVDPQPPGVEPLPHGKVFEIALSHGLFSPLYTNDAWPRPAHQATPGAARSPLQERKPTGAIPSLCSCMLEQ